MTSKCFRRPPRRSKNKVARERAHAKDQALTRYELLLTEADLDRIIGQIRAGHDAWFVKRQSNRVTHYVVAWRGRLMPTVYDGQRHQVITFLPPECLELPEYQEVLEAVNV